jgi:peptide-methionine (S)-S-oxide reductase
MLGVLGHRERGAAKAVLAAGAPLTALIAAGMGMERELALLLPSASEKEVLDAFSVAVINEEVGCAKLCLDAGAPVSSLLTAHAHSTAAHQAAVNDDVAMLKLLVERGADLSIKDTMWNGTPLGWARHEQKKQALAFLEEVLRGRS